MSSLSERTGIASRRTAGEERPRDLQEVVLSLVDGTEVRGVLHRAPGTRTLDFLNRQAEAFVAMTNAEVSINGQVEEVSFIALNKAHIVRLVEALDSAIAR